MNAPLVGSFSIRALRVVAILASLAFVAGGESSPLHGQAPASVPAGNDPAFSLSTGDVVQTEIFIFRGKATVLRVNYSKEKQAEFSKIASTNLQKNINILLNGQVASQILVTKPDMGTSFDANMASPDEAFKFAVALVNPNPAPAPVEPKPVPDTGAVEFALSSDMTIGKAVVVISKNYTKLEVTFPSKEKIDEYARVTKDNIGKPLKIVLNGKVASEEVIQKPGWGHIARVEMLTPEEAFMLAKALIPATQAAASQSTSTPIKS